MSVIPPTAFRLNPKAKFHKHGRVDGNTTAYEQKVLASLFATYNPSKILEIGTFNGLSTLNIARNSSAKAKITTVDIKRNMLSTLKFPIQKNKHTYNDERYITKRRIGELFKDTPEAKKITQIFSDSALLAKVVKKKYDFVFVDGSHSFEYTMNDSKFALSHIATKGVILWHDYGKTCWPGVKKALHLLKNQRLELYKIPKTSFVLLKN